jgi:Baseplate J-like protein
MPVTIEDLVASATQEDALAQELLLATDLGLPTTAWQPVQAVPVLMNVNAGIISSYSTTAAQFAQGGYASYAALMTDSGGNPITGWLDLRMKDQFGVERQPATYAGGSVPFASSSGNTYNYSPNSPLHFQNPTTGALFTSTSTGTLTNAGGSVAVQADVIGAASTTGIGVTMLLLTPFAGVSILPLTASLAGTDAESNPAFLTRGQAKLGTIDDLLAGAQPQPVTGAPDAAYYYVATTIPQGPVSSAPPYAVSAVISRCTVWIDIYSGDVNVYIGNASGTPPSGDVVAVNAAIQALVTPDGQTVNVLSVATASISFTATLYILASTGVKPADAIVNAEDSLATYAAGVPIGGFSTAAPNIIPLSQLVDVLSLANAGTIDVEISNVVDSLGGFPAGIDALGNPGLGQNGVPEFTATLFVVLV